MRLDLQDFLKQRVKVKFGVNATVGKLTEISDINKGSKDTQYIVLTLCSQSNVREERIAVSSIDAIGKYVQET
jgi:hypothetical protein